MWTIVLGPWDEPNYLSNSRALIPNPSVFPDDWPVEIHGYNIWNVHNKSNQTVGWFGWIPQSQRLIIRNCCQLSWIWPKKDIRYYKLAFFRGALFLQAIHVPKKNSFVMSGTGHWLECGMFILHYHQTHAGILHVFGDNSKYAFILWNIPESILFVLKRCRSSKVVKGTTFSKNSLWRWEAEENRFCFYFENVVILKE